MSLIITLFTREGIVMASDSRITLNNELKNDDGKSVQQLAVSQSDSNNKTFLAPNNIGISTCGQADIQGVPIAGFIDSFIAEHLTTNKIDVDSVPVRQMHAPYHPPSVTAYGISHQSRSTYAR